MKRRLLVAGWLMRPASRRRPSSGRQHQDGPAPSRRPPERPAPSRRPTAPLEFAPPLRRHDRVRLQYSPSPPYPGPGVATVLRTGGDLRPARHYCHSAPDVTPVKRSPAPTTACRYGLKTAGPTRQREPGRRWKPGQSDPREAGLQQAARSFLGAPRTINQIRRGVATVISHQAVGL